MGRERELTCIASVPDDDDVLILMRDMAMVDGIPSKTCLCSAFAHLDPTTSLKPVVMLTPH